MFGQQGGLSPFGQSCRTLQSIRVQRIQSVFTGVKAATVRATTVAAAIRTVDSMMASGAAFANSARPRRRAARRHSQNRPAHS
jgi:hypothetical protein